MGEPSAQPAGEHDAMRGDNFEASAKELRAGPHARMKAEVVRRRGIFDFAALSKTLASRNLLHPRKCPTMFPVEHHLLGAGSGCENVEIGGREVVKMVCVLGTSPAS
jgi:hypothetical protein